MKTGIVVFPGTNRERDMVHAIERVSGRKPTLLWHQQESVEGLDLVILPGGSAMETIFVAGLWRRILRS